MAGNFCAHCGAPITADTKFCAQCGTALQPQEAAQPQETVPPVPYLNAQPLPAKQKKPMKKGQKIAIIAAAATVAVLIFLYVLGTSGDKTGDPPVLGTTSPFTTNGGGRKNTGGKSLEQMLASGQAVQYERVALTDPQLGCEAVRSVAPSGWKSGGQVGWVIQSGAAPALVDFFIVSPDETARAGYVSPVSYAQPDPMYQLSEGQWFPQQVAPVKQYQNAETYAQAYFKQLCNLSSVQLVESKAPTGETAQALEAYKAYVEREVNAAAAQSQQMMEQQGAYMKMEHYIDAVQVTLRFTLEGVPCKAKVFVTIYSFVFTNTQNIPMMGQFTEQTTGWNTGPVGFRYYLAEESKFDQYEAASDMFFTNLITNEQWGSAVQQVSAKLFQDQLEQTIEAANAQLDAAIRQSQQLVEASKPKYSYSGDSSGGYSSRVMDGWNNVITDREYFETSDGGYTKMDSSYSNTYSNGSSFVQSDSALDLPSSWNKVSGSTMLP